MTIRRVAVVLNGRAGALLDDATAAGDLRAALAAAGLAAHFIPDEAPLPGRITTAIRTGADAVIVAGGDGTIACAAAQLAGGPIPLGIIPFGTMNLFAKDLRLPLGDVAAAVRVFAAGHVRHVDVGEVNGRVFLCASMLGLPVRLGRYREGSRGAGLRIWLLMARAALRLLIRGMPVKGRLQVRHKTHRVKAATLTVTVNAIDEASGLSFSRPHLDKGELGIYVVDPAGPLAYLGLACRLVAGIWRRDRGVRHYRAECATLNSTARGVQVMNDGEISLITPPLRYRVRPRALRVLTPAGVD